LLSIRTGPAATFFATHCSEAQERTDESGQLSNM
jgi:hypothetical protein